MSEFSDLPLIPALLNTLSKIGYTKPTPIQSQAIPPLLEGADLLGIAQTGTGKTAAFALPIINGLSYRKKGVGPRRVRVLILTPTRELASQIDASFAELGRGIRLSRCVVFGGVSQNPQVRTISRGVDILVATPGRLLDLMNQGYVRLDELETFVLDEADRMLDMGFINDIQKIIKTLPRNRQTLLFSATMPPNIEELAAGLLKDPVKVEVTPQATTVDKIKQSIIYVDKANKRDLLQHLIEKNSIQRALVFTRTKHAANKVAEELDKKGIKTTAIHGNKSQGAREKALLQFRKGQVRVLVATDIAARGIDVKEISHVINFDLPNEPENYVHRIGRTARAGLEGLAISFCDSAERFYLREIQRAIRMDIEVDTDHPFHSDTAANAPFIKPKPNGGGQRGGGGGGQKRMGGGKKRSAGSQRSDGGGKHSGGQHSRGERSSVKSEGGERSNSQRSPGQRSGGPRSGSEGEQRTSAGGEQPRRGKTANRSFNKSSGNKNSSNKNRSESGNRSASSGNKPTSVGNKPASSGNKPTSSGNRTTSSGNRPASNKNYSSPGNKRGSAPKANRGNRRSA
ncbi:MAG: DEAD/DEAH box helicase [Magnetococcales bacterium]|nr:DEAD/DEAH box helicase [Magnetococcales bacterium]